MGSGFSCHDDWEEEQEYVGGVATAEREIEP